MVGLTHITEEFQRLENAIGKDPISEIHKNLTDVLEKATSDIILVKEELSKLESYNKSVV